ncbi:hypothetical protein [Amycolatopsis nalaikhensis]|uniref:IclR-ED domain-containing protein n=1 Tax=Amycolatopsis nalaikhensis TaxID=715472 RepID=A0ABY8X820_9PSEU|nr:hypothetical protein [Amycolatopsis sp. 2-2]WIV52552.1 hypothetical protein QP939_26685 [Amycolatopsis sp. 2-2]
MTTRGWYEERTLTTVDTVGREVSVTTGLTRDPEGRLVAAIAISDSPSAIFRYASDTGDRTELLTNATSTVEELRRRANTPPR